MFHHVEQGRIGPIQLGPPKLPFMCLAFRILMCVFAMNLALVFGQGITLVRTGYVSSAPLTVAPGQITTFFVTGLQTVLTQPQKATSAPLPLSLAGLSIDILAASQSLPSVVVFHAPLLSVEQFDNCRPNGPHGSDCYITAITAQFPFELGPDVSSPRIRTTAIILENEKLQQRVQSIACDRQPPCADKMRDGGDAATRIFWRASAMQRCSDPCRRNPCHR